MYQSPNNQFFTGVGSTISFIWGVVQKISPSNIQVKHNNDNDNSNDNNNNDTDTDNDDDNNNYDDYNNEFKLLTL